MYCNAVLILLLLLFIKHSFSMQNSYEEYKNCLLFQVLCLFQRYLSSITTKNWYSYGVRSPVSMTFANLVMENVKERPNTSCSTPPLFWKRSIDDICTALPSTKVEDFHRHPNCKNKSMHSTPCSTHKSTWWKKKNTSQKLYGQMATPKTLSRRRLPCANTIIG